MMREFDYEVRDPDIGRSLVVDIDGVPPSFGSI
jgi:hypothetical protein